MQKDRKPGEKFTETVEPFVAEVREMAANAYQKLVEIKQEFGQKLQKTFNPGLGLGTGSKTSSRTNKEDDTRKED
jgi:hypothetical protein